MEIVSATNLVRLQRAQSDRHFMNQACVSTDKIWPNCLQPGEKQWQLIPAEKAQNRFD
jgi:hypothetical protein